MIEFLALSGAVAWVALAAFAVVKAAERLIRSWPSAPQPARETGEARAAAIADIMHVQWQHNETFDSLVARCFPNDSAEDLQRALVIYSERANAGSDHL